MNMNANERFIFLTPIIRYLMLKRSPLDLLSFNYCFPSCQRKHDDKYNKRETKMCLSHLEYLNTILKIVFHSLKYLPHKKTNFFKYFNEKFL